MRILALTNLYPNAQQPHRAAYNRQYFRALNGRDEIRVIAPIAWTDEWASRRSGAPPIDPTRTSSADGFHVDHPRYVFTPRVLRSWYGRFFRRSVRAAFDRAVREFRPDIVLASWAYPDGWVAVDLGHRAGLPVVVNVVGSDIVYAKGSRGRGAAEAVRRADGVWAVSADLARRVIGMGAEAARVRVIYNGVNTELFRPGDRAAARARIGMTGDVPLILFVGNLVPVKGLDVLVSALAGVSKRGVAFECRMIGRGPLREQLERQAADAGVADRVKFVGSVPHDALPDWFRAASLVVLPSRSEGVPNVLLEAAACDTPFVASRVGGIPEIVGWGRGALVEPDRPADLADAIAGALLRPDGLAPPERPIRRSFADAAAEVSEFLNDVGARYRSEKRGPQSATPTSPAELNVSHQPSKP